MRPILRPFPDRRPDYLAPWRRKAQSLVDPTKWLAAWDFTGVNGIPFISNGAGSFDMTGVSLFSYLGGVGATFPKNSTNAFAGMVIGAGKTALSLHFFYSEFNITFANGFGLGPLTLGLYNNGNAPYINDGDFGGFISPSPQNAGSPVAVGLTYGAGRVKGYGNGTLLFDVAYASPLVAINSLSIVSNNRSSINLMNPVVYDGELPAEAIASLASGHMPDISGNLLP